MKEYEPMTTFFDSLFEGITGAQKIVRAVSKPTKEHSSGVVRDFLIDEATNAHRRIFEAKERFVYRRRLRVA